MRTMGKLVRHFLASLVKQGGQLEVCMEHSSTPVIRWGSESYLTFTSISHAARRWVYDNFKTNARARSMIIPLLGRRAFALLVRARQEELKLKELTKEIETEALSKGVPLDEILPDQGPQPEDAYWLLGFEHEIERLNSRID